MQKAWDWLQQPLHLMVTLGSLIPILLAFRYIQTFTRQIPFQDQWYYSNNIAVAAKNGTLTLEMLFQDHAGHRLFFTNLVTVLATWLTNWDLRFEAYTNLALLILNFALLCGLLGGQDRRALLLAAAPISVLLFSLFQDVNLRVGFQTQWHFVLTFFLLALLLIQNFAPRQWVIIAAGVCALGSTLSLGSGFLAWPVLLLVLWAHGYRRWWQLAGWIITAGVVIGLYLSRSSIEVGAEASAAGVEGYTTISFDQTPDAIRLGLAMIGSPLAYGNFNVALGITLLGMGLFLYNLWIFVQAHALTLNSSHSWRGTLIPLRPEGEGGREMRAEFAAIWFGLASFTLLSALLIGISRVDVGAIERTALLQRYTTTSLQCWIALVALMALNHPRLSTLNTLFVMIAALLFLRTSIYGLQEVARFYNWSIERGTYSSEDECYLNYPLTRDYSCLDQNRLDQGYYLERTMELAAYRLTIFDQITPANVLPETYQPGSPIIIHSPSRWLNIFVRDNLLAGIEETALYHVAPPNALRDTHDFLQPLGRVAADLAPETLAAISAFINEQAQVWYISTPETAGQDTLLMDHLAAAGYVMTPYPIQAQRYREAKFSIWRFQQPPAETTTVFSFGEEAISLQDWSISSQGESRLAPTMVVAPCETIRVQSWWQAEQVPQFNYSATLVLLSPDGQPLAQKDAAIGDNLLQLWTAERLYFDERLLTLPCDLPAGDYQLAWGMYHQTDTGFQNLPASAINGAVLGERPVMTTIKVE